ncbi:leucine/isoleucine/valine transporter permease subunit [Sulfitobacter sp. THAF37]|uniref:branched-chain amino acid ABC transporter permease n=1 Tax=Sulfitobacter sp. THAF37 TaxID=2587855 RepID=UPI001268F5F9|nr:branched-chain amino acid ABC transporter permease [Sulfitobacter sp. THAF37]QFT57944.1 leucine/isoleucine/valine transporter permease subunit [Sulfitobacter sp. THAF37]
MRRYEIAVLVAGAVIAGLAGVFIDSGLQFLLCEVFVLFIMAQMWNLLAGYAGQVSFGQQMFVGLGGYGLCVIANNSGLPVWATVAIVPVLVGILAIPLGMVVFHLKHAYFAIGMWVAAEVVFQFVVKTPALGGSGGLVLRPGGEMMQGFPEQTVLPVVLFLSVALIVGLRVFLRSRLGLATLAVRDNEAAAEAAGVNIWRLHLILFTLTAAGTALAAALYYTTTLFVTPLDAFQAKWVIMMMFIVVIGGLGTLTGPVVGVVLFIGIREVMTAAGYSGSQNWIVMGLLAIGVLLFLPQGLWPAFSNSIRSLKDKASS